MRSWQSRPLTERIRILKVLIPLGLIPIVVFYQLQIAFQLEARYGHTWHLLAEIAFYSLAGPAAIWAILVWIERRLVEKEALEAEVKARTEQLAGLTVASPDAILSLDGGGRITSWNQGATRMFGYNPEDMLGRPVLVILPDAGEWLGEVDPDEALETIETWAAPAAGRPVRVALSRAHHDIGEPEGPAQLLVMRDVTVRSERADILEEERARIARDLHDSVAQTLYFLALKADQGRTQVTENPEETGRTLETMSRQARGAIRDVRRAIFGLKPLDWEMGGFLEALARYVEDFGREAGLQIDWRATVPERAVPPHLQPTIFRLVQESLNNVAKHASASRARVEIDLDLRQNNLLLHVHDDGSGFQPEEVERGMGMRQMEDRITRFGGRIVFDSRPGVGTAIRVTLPLVPGPLEATA